VSLNAVQVQTHILNVVTATLARSLYAVLTELVHTLNAVPAAAAPARILNAV